MKSAVVSLTNRSTIKRSLSTSSVVNKFLPTFKYPKLGIDRKRLASKCFSSFLSRSM